MNSQLSRRSLLKLLGGTLTTCLIPGCGCSLWIGKTQKTQNQFSEITPIDRLSDFKQKKFSGDEPEKVHQVLWNPPQGIKPESQETTQLAIVGGGMSGLISAYLLREYKPILLEQASRFGGNSKAESWNGIDYSIGAAYITEPDPNTPLARLLTELEIPKIIRKKTAPDPYVLNSKRYDHFFEGETSPKNSLQFKKIHTLFKNHLNETKGYFFPDIPPQDVESRNRINQLDVQSFKNYIESFLDNKLDPHLENALEHYCYSSFGASFSEISAASGINFFSGDMGGVWIAPGGNATIAEVILKKLSEHLPQNHLRTKSIVYDIRVENQGVKITYLDSQQKSRSILAQKAILACPKFVVAKILKDIEPLRLSAIQKLKYRSYLVGNLLIKKPIKDDFYDLFFLGKQKITDAVLGTYAKLDPTRSVLTLYRGMPYDGARAELYSPEAYQKVKQEFENEIDQWIRPLLGISQSEIEELRLARYGHPLPVASFGLISSGIVDEIQKPFKDKVYFIEQDNWALPAFETAAQESLLWCEKIKKTLI